MAAAEQAPDHMAMPKRLPLVVMPENRDETTSKDAKLVNAFAERVAASGEYFVEKRPGLSAPRYSLLDGAINNGVGRGIYLWYVIGITQTNILPPPSFRPVAVDTPVEDLVLVAISGKTIYYTKLVAGVPVTTALSTLPYPFLFVGGKFRFTPVPVIHAGVNDLPGLLCQSGTQLYVLSWDTATKLAVVAQELGTGVPLPAGLVQGMVYLDGYVFVMDAEGRIFNSDVNDVTTWSGAFITAQLNPDGGVFLGRQLNYVVALKQWTTEFFYDAGNVPPGSPLTSVPGAILPYGCASADTVQELDGDLYWVTTNRSGSPQVIKLSNLQGQIISSPPVERLLQSNQTSFISFTFKCSGHRFYVVSLVISNITLVFDVDQGLWYEWTDQNGNYWNIVDATLDMTGLKLAQDQDSGSIYIVDADTTYPNDNGILVPVEIYTPLFDAKIDRRKYLKQMRFNSDQTTGSLLQIRVTDNDYQTYSNFREVDLSKVRPILNDCGTFYRRAWHIRHLANTALRIRSVDLQMDIGTL